FRPIRNLEISSYFPLSRRGSRWWNGLWKIEEPIGPHTAWFTENIHWRIGDGGKIQFWTDRWKSDHQQGLPGTPAHLQQCRRNCLGNGGITRWRLAVEP
ncbi:hypothetical protein Ancab_029694, partial [Ancistrocladus abbreviatus]